MSDALQALTREIDRASMLDQAVIETVPVKVLTDARDELVRLEAENAEFREYAGSDFGPGMGNESDPALRRGMGLPGRCGHARTVGKRKGLIMADLDEPILPNDYPVYPTYAYVADGQPIASMIEGNVDALKRALGASEIRRCDLAGRGWPKALPTRLEVKETRKGDGQ
jgi:hypothetical protein